MAEAEYDDLNLKTAAGRDEYVRRVAAEHVDMNWNCVCARAASVSDAKTFGNRSVAIRIIAVARMTALGIDFNTRPDPDELPVRKNRRW